MTSTAAIIDGRSHAQKIKKQIAAHTHSLHLQHQKQPCLAMVLVGDDEASQIYVRYKQRACEEVGIRSKVCKLPHTTSTSHQELCDLLQSLSQDPHVHGVLLQLPLPSPLSGTDILQHIHPSKDVDGLTQWNQGALSLNRSGLYPCTPLACMHLLQTHVPSLSGQHVAMVGNSPLVGASLSRMLLHAGCTVTTVHKQSMHPEQLCRHADILIVAAGKPGLITKEWLKQGTIVIDVGIHRVDGKIVGDVNFEDAQDHIRAITPVPGGVGPMTVAMLLQNCMKAYTHIEKISLQDLRSSSMVSPATTKPSPTSASPS